MQIAFLTARPEVLAHTLALDRLAMGWLSEVIVITPEAAAGGVRTQLARPVPIDDQTIVPGEGLNVEVMNDETLLGTGRVGLAHHQVRNFALRAALARSSVVADRLIVSDDDARPMTPIGMDFFVDGGGRLVWYRYGRLGASRPVATEFDEGQITTARRLSEMGTDVYAAAVHAPQVFDRDLWREVLDRLGGEPGPVCEWTTFLNIGRSIARERFAPVEPYRTLAWPENEAAWRTELTPAEPTFENWYPQHYRRGGVFAGLPAASLRPSMATEKRTRWEHYRRLVGRGWRPPDSVTGWDRIRFRARHGLWRATSGLPGLHRRLEYRPEPFVVEA